MRSIECEGHVNILMTEANAKCEPFVLLKELSAQEFYHETLRLDQSRVTKCSQQHDRRKRP
jgi:hypothetical protein